MEKGSEVLQSHDGKTLVVLSDEKGISWISAASGEVFRTEEVGSRHAALFGKGGESLLLWDGNNKLWSFGPPISQTELSLHTFYKANSKMLEGFQVLGEQVVPKWKIVLPNKERLIDFAEMSHSNFGHLAVTLKVTLLLDRREI